MKNTCSLIRKYLYGAVALIGLYMIYTYWGPVSPPLLSGIAFTLIGASAFGRHA